MWAVSARPPSKSKPKNIGVPPAFHRGILPGVRFLRRCTYPLAALLALVCPRPDPADWPRWRLPWRAMIRRRRRIFPDDVGPEIPDRMLSEPERAARQTRRTVLIRRPQQPV